MDLIKSHTVDTQSNRRKVRSVLCSQHPQTSAMQEASMMQEVDNFVIVLGPRASDTQPNEVSFTIRGSPIAQNGWKLAWRSRRQPILYDSLQKQKLHLRVNIRNALIELRQGEFPIFPNWDIRVELTFNLHNVTGKDVDNMMKYIFDAMQEVLYRNDSSIMVAVVQKVQAHEEDQESTIVKISRLENDYNNGHGIYI
jgi:Holliday junction resolvase RusA-like endonuclease